MKMKKSQWLCFRKNYLGIIFLVILIAIVAFGCGSGGSSGGGSTTTDTFTIRGSVGGTIIVAVVDDQIVASYDTAGRTPDVDIDRNGSNDAFSITLSGIPVGKDVKIYLIESGDIFTLYYDSEGNSDADTNVFWLACASDVNLGYLSTTVISEGGRAIPEINPTDNACVESANEDTQFPVSLNEPGTGGLTLGQLILYGLDALKEGWVLRAKTYFEAAEARTGSLNTNDADTARFFYAVTRVAALGYDTYSDSIPNNGLNNMGDILDGFGAPADDTQRSIISSISFPDPLPNASPTGSELQNFMTDIAIPELQGAIANLDAVSQSFNREWTEPFDKESVESDYGDVLFFRSLFKGSLASIYIQYAYNLDVDIDNFVNTDKTIEQFLNDEPQFLSLTATPDNDLALGKTNLDSGLEDLGDAIEWIDAETDDQDDDYVNLNLSDYTADRISKAQADIDDARYSLDGPTFVNGNGNHSGWELDLSNFFAGLDFRSPNLLPGFSDNHATGLFPDGTFAGTFGAGIDLNEDGDPADGTADVMQADGWIVKALDVVSRHFKRLGINQ